MRNIKILHLYSQALDLYGDYKNIDVLCDRITETGNDFSVTTVELGEPVNPEGFDMVYIGHGKARNLAAVAKHLIKYSTNVNEAIESGQVWLSTGNSRQLFGKSFSTPDNELIKGTGLFDYTGVETGKVFVSDMLGRPVYDKKAMVYGFANRTSYLVGKNKYPLFEVITGFSDGNKPDGKEGTLYKNFFATWSMGPLLARNPSVMCEILKRILGDDYRECDFSLEQRALDLVISEFKTV